MDTHTLYLLLWRMIEPVAWVFIFLLIIGGVMVWQGLKSKRMAKQLNKANLTSSKAPAQKRASRNIREWILVGEYAVFVHQLIEQVHITGHEKERVIYAEVEYRNDTREENMSCRRNQWRLFSDDGYSYEARSEMTASALYREKPYFGGDRYINPGMKARGWLAFPVPENAKITSLQFMTAFLGTKTADIDVESAIEQDQPVTELPMN